METVLIEATNGPHNWGKFMVGRFTKEWEHRSAVDDRRCLLPAVGWGEDALLVVDLQTGEGAIFSPHGYATADLEKHRIWVCPMFPHLLRWLYEQDLTDLSKLPAHVDFPDAPFEWAGYRREGITIV